MSKIKKAMPVLFALVLLMPLVVMAQLPDPTVPVGGSGLTLTDIEGIITTVARFLIVIALIVAVLFIVWGGIRWMAAGGNEAARDAARSTIWNGIIGAAIVLAVGLILQTLAEVIALTFFNF